MEWSSSRSLGVHDEIFLSLLPINTTQCFSLPPMPSEPQRLPGHVTQNSRAASITAWACCRAFSFFGPVSKLPTMKPCQWAGTAFQSTISFLQNLTHSASFFIMGNESCDVFLYLKNSQHGSGHWTLIYFINVTGPWVFTRFISYHLEHMYLTKTSNIAAISC